MTNETKQTAVEWLINYFNSYDRIKEMLDCFEYEIKQAKEMEVAGKEMSYADGYSAGYYRALELVEWKIKHELKIENK